MNRAERRRQKKKAKKEAKKTKSGKGINRSPEQNALTVKQSLELALQHHAAGRLPEAESIFQQILQADPNQPVAFHLLGVIAHQMGKYDTAVDLITKALTIQPDYAEAHGNLGNALKELGKLDEAVESYHKVLAINPDYAGAHNNLGNTLKEMGRFDDAVASFQKALAIKPDLSEASYNLGNTLKELGRLDDAVASYHKAIALKPDFADALSNLGNVYYERAEWDEALAAYDRALAVEPDHVAAHEGKAQVLLLLGDFKQGWLEYEWRGRGKLRKKRDVPLRPWSGEEVKGKTVLIWSEQGVGDEILFAGMVFDLLDAGAKVILECDQRLIPLFERSFAGVEFFPRTDGPVSQMPREGIDFQTSGGNLGRWLRPSLDAFHNRPPYLAADNKRRDELSDRYRQDNDGLLVGIAWVSKNPEIGLRKSMSLMDFRPLASMSGITMVDLQYGDTTAEREAFEKETGQVVLRDPDIDQMADLDAFAAQVASMDLVISVSNTTVHLAGALGVPAWVLLNTVPVPVWMVEREDSPWYPSVRLFRQSKAGEWSDVIESAKNALAY